MDFVTSSHTHPIKMASGNPPQEKPSVKAEKPSVKASLGLTREIGRGRGRGRGRGVSSSIDRDSSAQAFIPSARGRGRGRGRTQVLQPDQFEVSSVDPSTSSRTLVQTPKLTRHSSKVVPYSTGSTLEKSSDTATKTNQKFASSQTFTDNSSDPLKTQTQSIDAAYQKASRELKGCKDLAQVDIWCSENIDILKYSLQQLSTSSTTIESEHILHALFFRKISSIINKSYFVLAKEHPQFEHFPNIFLRVNEFLICKALKRLPSERLLFIKELISLSRLFPKTDQKTRFDLALFHLSLSISRRLPDKYTHEIVQFYELIISHFVYGITGNYLCTLDEKKTILTETNKMITYIQIHAHNHADEPRFYMLQSLALLLTSPSIQIDQTIADNIFRSYQQYLNTLLLIIKATPKKLWGLVSTIQKFIHAINKAIPFNQPTNKIILELLNDFYELSQHIILSQHITKHKGYDNVKNLILSFFLQQHSRYHTLKDLKLNDTISTLFQAFFTKKSQTLTENDIDTLLHFMPLAMQHLNPLDFSLIGGTEKSLIANFDDSWFQILSYLIKNPDKLTIDRMNLVFIELLSHQYENIFSPKFTPLITRLKALVFNVAENHLKQFLQPSMGDVSTKKINIFLRVMSVYLTIFSPYYEKQSQAMNYPLILRACFFLKDHNIISRTHLVKHKFYRVLMDCLDLVMAEHLTSFNLRQPSGSFFDESLISEIVSPLLKFIDDSSQDIARLDFKQMHPKEVKSAEITIAKIDLILKTLQKYNRFTPTQTLTTSLSKDIVIVSFLPHSNKKSMNSLVKQQIMDSDPIIHMQEEYSFMLHGFKLPSVDFRLQYQNTLGTTCYIILEMQGRHHFHASTDTRLITKNKYVRKRLLVMEAMKEEAMDSANKDIPKPSEENEPIYRYLEISCQTYFEFSEKNKALLTKTQFFLNLVKFASKNNNSFYKKFTRSDILAETQSTPSVLQ